MGNWFVKFIQISFLDDMNHVYKLHRHCCILLYIVVIYIAVTLGNTPIPQGTPQKRILSP